MGSGKSTLGKKMALLLKMPFFDLDEYIERRENTSVADLFASQGESGFRELENKYLKELLNENTELVLALGGGTICYHNLLEYTKSNGLLVYLYLPVAALVQRLIQNTGNRPLLNNLNDKQIEEFVLQLMEKRQAYYEQAHLKVNGINLRPEQLVNEINTLL